MTVSEKMPLWTCPECGHQFVTRNMSHSCGEYSLDFHFAGKNPGLRALFDKYVEFVRRCGPVTVYAQKTRITFQTRGRFTNIVVRKQWLECSLWLKRKIESPLFHRIDSFGPRDRVHYLRLRDDAQLNDELSGIVREAYAVGCQENFDETRKDR